MPTQIQVTLYKTDKVTHDEITALLTKIYAFGTTEGYEIRAQSTNIS